jgi:hypothetical protein
VLVEPDALRRALEACERDASSRQAGRVVQSRRRVVEDDKLRERFKSKLIELFPACPDKTADEITRHACLKHSGRVGRSAAAKELDPQAIELAVRAYVRHRHTDYDLLVAGTDRHDARFRVANQVENFLEKWRRPG